MSYERNQPRRKRFRGGTSGGPRRGRKARRFSLEPVFLEDRTLLSNLEAILEAYNDGVKTLAQVNKGVSTAASIVDRALGGVSIPLVNLSLNDVAGLDSDTDFLAPFSADLNTSASGWGTVTLPAGFRVDYADDPQNNGNLVPESNGTLIELSYSNSWTPSLTPLVVTGGNGPWSYLNGDGGLFGGINVTATVNVSVTLGVSQNSTGALSFFVTSVNAQSNPSSLNVTLNGSIPSSSALSGSLLVGDIGEVSASITGDNALSVTGGLGFATTLSIPANQQPSAQTIGQTFGATINGSLNLSAAFEAQVPLLSTELDWGGTFTDTFGANGGGPSFHINLGNITPQSIVNGVVSQLFSLVGTPGDVPVLGPLIDQLNQPLPLIGESIAQLTGLDNDLPDFPSFPSFLNDVGDGITGSYPLLGGTLTLDITPATILDYLNPSSTQGPVGLISWQASGDVSLIDEDVDIPILSFGIPGIASAEVDATFGIDASLDYNVGFGLDTSGGVYFQAGTASDPTLGLSFGVTAGIQGQVEVLGLPLAELGGDVGFDVAPYVTLTAPPGTDPSKVYAKDLALFGSNPVTDLFSDLSAGVEGNFEVDLYAKLDLLFFSHTWNWDKQIPVFNFETSPTWPAAIAGGDSAGLWSQQVKQSGGTMTFTGTPGGDNLQLSENSPGTVTIDWAGVGQQTFGSAAHPITQFDFIGDNGNDHLTTSSNFKININANESGKGGNDYLEGGAGQDTLIAGTGKDTLQAGSGNDSLEGGAGSDFMIAGTGTDTLDASHGNGNVTIFGGSGPSTVYGSSGSDEIYGGSGKSTIYGGSGRDTIDGGSGDYVIHSSSLGDQDIIGGSGSDTIYINGGTAINDTIDGGTGGHNQIYDNSGGGNLIYGEGAADTIDGGTSSNDTMYGGPGGGNTIDGGAGGNNLLYGGGNGDVLIAGTGSNSTLIGGSGNETLYGGVGTDVKRNAAGDGVIYTTKSGAPQSSGSNLLIGGSGDDVLFGDSSGHNTLQGGSGAENYQSATASRTEQADTLAAPITQTTSTTITVTALNQLSTLFSGKVIQIGGEQMLVTGVNSSTDTLTVKRGYNNTKAATHAINAAIDLVLSPAPASVTSDASSINDTLYAGTGGDYLDAGTGTDAIYGGPGNDSIQLQFTPTGQTQPQDTIMGGGGEDMLVLKPTPVTSLAAADPISTQTGTLAAAITSTTATSISVSDPAAFSTASQVIQIDGEQMLVTSINLSTGTLTVVRGYNNTKVTTHNAGAAIDGEPELPTPGNYYMYFNQVPGTTNQYLATLSSLGPNDQPGTLLGQVRVDMLLDSDGVVDIQNVAMEGGPGNNVIRVDPSVTRNMYLFGGPGNNTLIAGSGSDTLVAGSGTSVLYGGSGDDVLYGGDLPSQDVLPGQPIPGQDPLQGLNSQDANPPSTTGELSQETGTVTNGSDEITGLASTYQLSVGQLVTQFVTGSATAAIPNGTTITAIGSDGTSITISNPASVPNSTNPSETVTLTFGSKQPEGHDTLIAGSGNSELFAGSGGDLLIGGTAVLQNGQFELPSNGSAGRDVLVGGSGDDLLIAAPNSLGAVMLAGSGNDTLIGANAGMDDMEGGPGPGSALFLGGQGSNYIHAGPGDDTLVAGLGGASTLVGGTGIDSLYASYNSSEWQAAVAAAAKNFHVIVTPPAQPSNNGQPVTPSASSLDQYFAQSEKNDQTVGEQLANFASLAATQGLPGPGSASDLQTPIEDYLKTVSSSMKVGDLIAGLLSQQLAQVLTPGPLDTLAFLLGQDPGADTQLIANLLSLDHPPQTFTSNEKELLTAFLVNEAYQLLAQGNTYEQEYLALQQELANVTQLTPAQNAQLSSLDSLANETWTNLIKINGDFQGTQNLLVGGSGNDTFYNPGVDDTIIGGGGAEQAVLFQADGVIKLTSDPDGKGIDVQVNGQAPLEVGDGVNNISNINVVGVETGNANGDTVIVNVPNLPTRLTGLYVKLGNGNGDVIDAHNTEAANDPNVSATETLLGGAGDDTISINAHIATGSVYQGSNTSELIIYGSNSGDHVTISDDNLTVDGVPVNSQAGVVNGTTIKNLENTSYLFVGQSISGQGIQNGTTITAIAIGSGSVTISRAATTSGKETLTFGTGFQKVDVFGGPGSNTFTSDGTIPYVVLMGGSRANTMTVSGGTSVLFGGGGVNTMTVSGGTSTLLGGSGPNTYNLSGSGTYAAIGSTGTNTFNLSGGTATITGGAGNNQYNITGAGTYALTGGAGANMLVIHCAISGDAIYLSQSGSTIKVSGTIDGADINATASNMSDSITDSVYVYGAPGDDINAPNDNILDASGMTMGVYLQAYGYDNALYGGAGADTLIGGSGGDNYLQAGTGNNSDIFYVSGDNSTYIGAGDNTLVYAAQPGDQNIVVYGDGLWINGNGQMDTAYGNGSVVYENGMPFYFETGQPFYYLAGTFIPYYASGIGNVDIQDGAKGTITASPATSADVPEYENWNYVNEEAGSQTIWSGTWTKSGNGNYDISYSTSSPWVWYSNASPSYGAVGMTWSWSDSWSNASTPSVSMGNWVSWPQQENNWPGNWPNFIYGISFSVSGSLGTSFLGIPISSGNMSFTLTISGYPTYTYWTPNPSYTPWYGGVQVDAGIDVSNLTAVATSAKGAVVNFPTSGPNAFTTGGAEPQTSGLTYYEIQNGKQVPVESGSTVFPIGTTKVYATAADGYGRTSASTFDVTVLPQNVSNDATEIAVTATPSATVYGQPETFTATVVNSSSGASLPTGTVTFKDGTKTLGTCTLSTSGGVTTATFTTSALAVGTHSITAIYDSSVYDLTSTSAPLTFKVSQDATTTAVTASPTTTVYGQSVTFKATVSVNSPGASTPTGTVTFKDGTKTLRTGTLSTSGGVTTATFTTSALAVGTHSITAVYDGDIHDLTSTSAALASTVSSAYNLSKSSVTAASPWALPAASSPLPTVPGPITVADTSASTTTTAPRIAGGAVDRPSAGGSASPSPSHSVMGDLAFIDTNAAGSDQPLTPPRRSATPAGVTAVSIPARSGLLPPSDIRVAWTKDAPDDGEPLHGADSTGKVHDLALSSQFVDED